MGPHQGGTQMSCASFPQPVIAQRETHAGGMGLTSFNQLGVFVYLGTSMSVRHGKGRLQRTSPVVGTCRNLQPS